MKKLTALILSVLMVFLTSACSADKEPEHTEPTVSTTDEPTVNENDSTEIIDAAALPSKVDLRNYEGQNYVTPVKRQKFGDCWTFSLAASAEIAYLFANDMGVPAGELNDQVNFSEKYIAWYLYHGITGDDVVKGRVRASQVGEGFDPSAAESSDERAVYSFGGEFVHYANLFGSGFGPVDESDSVNGEYPFAYDNASYGWQLPLNAEYRCAPSSASLLSSLVLPCPAEQDADGNYVFSEEGLIAIKSELYQGHGVSIAFCTSTPGYNYEHRAAYYNGDRAADHAVTVVGYDDNYPKEYFSRTDTEGNVLEESIPPEDGAFIIKNSWGIVDEEEDGYFYLSYYDHSLYSPMSYVFDSRASVKHAELNYDQYDLMMTRWYGNTDYTAETKMANVFDAEEDESLCRIAYRTSLPDTEVTYEIYKDITDGDPASGTLLETGVSRHLYAGFFRIDLHEEYPLKKGEKYSVVLTMKHTDGDDGRTVYSEVFPYSTAFSSGLSVRGIVNEGESYLYTDGKWSDMTAAKDSLIERAYQQCVAELGSRKTMTPIRLDSKATFIIDNYPIKAILSPSSGR